MQASFGRYPPGKVLSTGKVCVIGMGGSPHVLVTPTDDRTAVTTSLKPCSRSTFQGSFSVDLRASLALAGLIARTASYSRIVVYIGTLDERSYLSRDHDSLLQQAQTLRRLECALDIVVFVNDDEEKNASEDHYSGEI